MTSWISRCIDIKCIFKSSIVTLKKVKPRVLNNTKKSGPVMVYKITSLFMHIKGKLLETHSSPKSLKTLSLAIHF